jgi:hypothetical protein
MLGVVCMVNGGLSGAAIVLAIEGYQFAEFGLGPPEAIPIGTAIAAFLQLTTIGLLVLVTTALEKHAPLRPRVPGMVANGLVVSTLPCVECAYDQRTRSVRDVCTECGTAVKASLDRSETRWGAQHFDRLARAARLMAIWGSLTGIYVLCLTGFFTMLGVMRWSGPGEEVFVTLFAGMALAGAAHISGFWRMTRAPRGRLVGVNGWIIRLGSFAIAAAASVPLEIMLVQVMFVNTIGRPQWVNDVTLTTLACFPGLVLISTGVAIAFGLYHARLCRNVGLYALGAWHLWISRIVAAGAALLALAFGTLMAREMFRLDWLPISEWTYLMGMLAALGIGGLGYFAATILLFATAKRFRKLAADLEKVAT